jgi:HSP20 family molecular chaperone IbpA
MAQNALVKKQEKQTEVNVPEWTRQTVTYTPRCDIFETNDELVLFADLPGVQPADVSLRLENGQLEVHARCMPHHGQEDYLACEYGIGDFYRTFTIDEVIDSDKISAELKQGVLTVHLPKSEAVKPRQIQVKAS